jgi:hypothetical protein
MRSSAALEKAITSHAAGPIVAHGQEFAACLARWDHQVPAATFYNAVAMSALDLVAKRLPLLGRSGYGPFGPWRTGPKGYADGDPTALVDAIAVPGFLQAVHLLQDEVTR